MLDIAPAGRTSARVNSSAPTPEPFHAAEAVCEEVMEELEAMHACHVETSRDGSELVLLLEGSLGSGWRERVTIPGLRAVLLAHEILQLFHAEPHHH